MHAVGASPMWHGSCVAQRTSVTGRTSMKGITTIVPRFVILVALAVGAVTGTHLFVAERVASSAPVSVMGPDYNPPPPWIPVS